MMSSGDLASLEDHFSGGAQKQKNLQFTSTMEMYTTESKELSPLPSVISDKAGSISAKIGWKFLSAFACLCLVNLVCAIDATIIAVALPVSPCS